MLCRDSGGPPHERSGFGGDARTDRPGPPPLTARGRDVLFRATAGAGSLAILAALAELPGANGPAEWRWAYRPIGLAPLWLPVLAALALLAVVRWRPPGLGGRLLLVALGVVFTLALNTAQPGGLGRVTASLVSRNSFSYLYDAALAGSARDLLAGSPTAAGELSLHSRTHPPGALLAIRALDSIARRLGPPRGALALGAAQAIENEMNRARDRRRPVPAQAPSPWTPAALAFLLVLASALAALPLYRLALAWGLSETAAGLAAALWLAVPARSLFTPSLDQALALVPILATALAAGPGRARALAAGAVIALGCFTSYGLLGALPLVMWIAATAPDGPEAPSGFALRPRLVRAAATGAGFLLPWLALALAGYPAWERFRDALATHRSMAVATRSYPLWLAWNPYDFALLCGPAVVILAVAALFVFRRGALGRGLLGAAGLFLLLWLSGSVRGEVGRIWLFEMPFACLGTAAAIDRFWGAAGGRAFSLLGLQALLALALGASMIFVS
ncbi:MAG TPA: hypothetical protein VN783_14265 [Thermoanaerobaculia bacterium]|nr:hypothetical protein [Thermoanaerobaculia bacterium]